MSLRREPIGSNQQKQRQIQRQNSFLSPITSTTLSNRRLSSSRSSLVHSPERSENNHDRKRKRLSLLPANANSMLGAPRLLNPPNLRRQSIVNIQATPSSNLSSNIPISTPSTLKSHQNNTVQELVQNSISRNIIPSNSQRRSRNPTLNSRRESNLPPSSAGNINRYETPISTTRLYSYNKPQDPRPIRSYRFQSKVQDQLFEYLSTNRFDIDMKHPLTMKSLKNPTQKDFVLIFQWLYKKLDPGFKFNRSIEQDVYTLLKFLEYPFLDTINKSQISAVGGSNWPVFLGMLHWLLNLVKETLEFDNLDLNAFQEFQSNETSSSMSVDNSTVLNENSVMNKLFITYALKSYKAFLAFGEDNYSDFYGEMQNDYQNYIDAMQKKIDNNLELNENLQETYNTLNEKYNLYFDEAERANALKSDVAKFQSYIDTQKQRQTKWPNIIEKAKSDINNIKESIKNIHKEKQDIISDLEKKNMTLKDIEELHKERAKLTLSLNSIDSEQKNIDESIKNQMSVLKSQFRELQTKIDLYNNLMYQVLNNVNLPSPPDASTLIINSIDEEYQSSKLGFSPHEIIPIQSTLRNSLNSLKIMVQSNITTIQDEILQAQELLDDLKLSIVSYTDRLEELEDSLSKSRKEYSDLNEKYTTDTSNRQFEYEARAKEIRLFKLQNTENRKSIESKWIETQKYFKKAVSVIGEKRTQLVCDIAHCLDYVVSFKSDVMSELESAAAEVHQELKQEVTSASELINE